MRILVMLNPTNKYGTKGAYTELRKFLINDGYIKLQPEVFMKVGDTRKSCLKHENRIKSYLPPAGEVRMLIFTERQFKNCILCQEKPNLHENLVGAKNTGNTINMLSSVWIFQFRKVIHPMTDIYAEASKLGNKIVDRALDIKPTIKIKEGNKIKQITNISLDLPPVEVNQATEKYVRTRR